MQKKVDFGITFGIVEIVTIKNPQWKKRFRA